MASARYITREDSEIDIASWRRFFELFRFVGEFVFGFDRLAGFFWVCGLCVGDTKR